MDFVKNIVKKIQRLRHASTLPYDERILATAAARAGLSEWTSEIMIPRMIKEVETGSIEIQRSAISALRSAGIDAVEAVPVLMAFFDRMDNPRNSDVQNYARKEAAYAVEDIMRQARQLIEAEERSLRELESAKKKAQAPTPSPEARINREEYARTLADLTAATQDPSPEVRSASMYALASLGASYHEVVPVIRARLNDEDAEVRGSAANLLGNLRPPKGKI